MENPAPSRSNAALYGITAVLALAVTGIAVWRTCGMGNPGTAAEGALPMPESGPPDLRLHDSGAFLTSGSPTAVRFDFPGGSENGALIVASGADFTGIGAPNTALGDPVFAIADGKVIQAGKSAPELGNVVVIAHTTPDGRTLRSVYGSLDKVEVTIGSLVARGVKIGTMGTADGHRPAGLHFTLEGADSPDPCEALRKLRAAVPENPAPSPLSKM